MMSDINTSGQKTKDTPRICLIVAQGLNRVIGHNNEMPWHIPEDLQYFKRTTLGKPVIMGRKTFESIGRPLPQRPNIVITRQQDWQAEGVEVAHSIDQAIEMAKELGDFEEIMVIGGAEIYRQSLPMADRLYITQVQAAFEGDAFFPEYTLDEWRRTHCDDETSKMGISSRSKLTYEILSR